MTIFTYYAREALNLLSTLHLGNGIMKKFADGPCIRGSMHRPENIVHGQENHKNGSTVTHVLLCIPYAQILFIYCIT
jgi:hypothetical protein